MSASRSTLAFVIGVVLIDMLSFGIIMPVLPGLIMDLAHVGIDRAAVLSGWLGAGYALMQFVFAPLLGNLSDRYGRRPVMLACVATLGLDFLLMALAPAFWWLVAGRLVSGMTGASYSAAYAAVADMSPPERRAANFGLMGTAFGVGFVVGPALGGLMASIGPRMPFFAAAALALANFLFGLVFLTETLAPENRRAFDWRRANAFAALSALQRQSGAVLWFVAALGVWQLAQIVYPVMWSYFTIAAYGFSARQVGLSLAMVGLTSALVQGVALRLVLPRIGERKAVILGLIGMAAGVAIYAVARETWQVYLGIAVGAVTGFVQPSIAGLNSRAVDAKSQGELQGATQSVGSIAAVIGPLLYTGIFAAFTGPRALAQVPVMPMVAALAIAAVAVALFLGGARRMRARAVEPVPNLV